MSSISADLPRAFQQSVAISSDAVATKLLLFKPKSAKTAVSIPILVLARQSAAVSSKALEAHVKGSKDARAASEDLWISHLGKEKTVASPFSLLVKEKLAAVTVVVDSEVEGKSIIVKSEEGTDVEIKADEFLSQLKAIQSDGEGQAGKVIMAAFDTMGEQPVAAPAAKVQAAAASVPDSNAQASDENAAEIIGITEPKSGDFSEWYRQVVIKSEMIDNFEGVNGCYILRPWSYSMWESIQSFFDAKIKKLGVQNCNFPMFISKKCLEAEESHIDGFSAEVAWITRAGKSELDPPVAIRPTSETSMYPYYSKWIRSHRDLPLKLNQWNSVVRWEFKNPQPFLRTREFLWQEGHTAFLRKEEADIEVLEILKYYTQVYQDLLAVPVIPGLKSENERFPGGDFTTTVEGFIPQVGRGIQGGTSHGLGQNFAKMFNIMVEDPALANDKDSKAYVYQNSWGLSTRTLGVMVMTHGDDKGLVCPPRVAPVQVVIVPLGLSVKSSAAERASVTDACDKVAERLIKVGVRVHVDHQDHHTPGFKFAAWELKGVPLRLEIGPKDLQKKQVFSARRDTGAKSGLELSDLETAVPKLLETIQQNLLDVATEKMNSSIRVLKSEEWEKFSPCLEDKCLLVVPWCESPACEEDIKVRTVRSALGDGPVDTKAPSAGAKSLCIPHDQERWGVKIESGVTKCIACEKHAVRMALFGRSY